MELTIRDWMVIIGALLILAVLIDAVRRMRSERYSRVKVNLVDPETSEAPTRDEELNWLKELPNGGARIVEREDLVNASRRAQAAAEEPAEAAAELAETEVVAPEPVEEEELLSGVSSVSPEQELAPGNIDWLDDLAADTGASLEREEPPGPGRLPREIDPEVFMLNVVSRDPKGFRGRDIAYPAGLRPAIRRYEFLPPARV